MNPQHMICRKWYRELFADNTFDTAFEQLLADENRSICDTFSDDPAENILTALYRCDEVEQKYQEKGIDREILLDTLSDIVVWTYTWYDLTGTFGLKQTGWINNSLSMKLFKLGRLQFCADQCETDVPEWGLKKDDAVVDIHIQAGGALTPEACKASFKKAIAFYDTFYPEYVYSVFTCHSWLLDPTLKQLLPPQSNILAFQNFFYVTRNDVSDAALRYIFCWDAVREKVPEYEAKSKLEQRIKEHVLAGGKLYESFGVIKKESVM